MNICLKNEIYKWQLTLLPLEAKMDYMGKPLKQWNIFK